MSFEKDKYVLIKGLLNKDSCKYLTNSLKKAVTEKQTTQDTQCPNSEAIYGHQDFDKLLEDLLPIFEEATGKKLYPTYSYARLYNTGEELKVHQDRPSCEISATLTLGVEGNPWAIYMSDNEDKSNSSELYMNVGDAVLYCGMEKYHWRDKFEGDWQAQVFLHYVDAEGPHAEWKYDKRNKLNHHKSNVDFPTFVHIPNYFNSEYCDEIIKEYTKNTYVKEKPYLDNQVIDLSVRNVDRVEIPFEQGIGSSLVTTSLNFNNKLWQFDITHSNQSEFLIYNIDNKYESHVDITTTKSNEFRKLTAIAILNDNYEGGKFYIHTNSKREYINVSKGDLIIFPSYELHGVEPITKGTRYSVVTWLVGPSFK